MTDVVTDELIGFGYAALFSELPWTAFLSRLVNDRSNGRAVFLIQGERDRQSSGVAIHVNSDDSYIKSYSEYYGGINPLMTHRILRHPGAVLTDLDVIDRSQLMQTEFYNDFLRPQGIEGLIALNLTRHLGGSVMLSATYRDSNTEVGAEMVQRFSALRTLMQRVVRQASDEHLSTQDAHDIFDRSETAYCTLSTDLKPKSMTAAFERIVSETGLCRRTTLGQIRFTVPEIQQALEHILSRYHELPAELKWRGFGYEFQIFRLSGKTLNILINGPRAGILIRQLPCNPLVEHIEHIRLKHNLTAAEFRAVEAIMRGATIRDIAQTNQISIETVRSQIKSVFNKTGYKSQRELLLSCQTKPT